MNTSRETSSGSGKPLPLLAVRDLVVRLPDSSGGTVSAVNGLTFAISRGESLAIVGESGSGKSMTALAILGLLPGRGRITGGRVLFEGRDLAASSAAELRAVRGRGIGMVFQDPTTSLNPVLTIGLQLTEGLRQHTPLDAGARRARAIELLGLVGIPDPEIRVDDYPHEFSGGQRQRIVIAMAIACEPLLLIADEPTTSLDVTIQAQIVELLKGLQKKLGMAIIWITHDLALVTEIVDRVAVMYAGSVVEEASVRDLFRGARHPYTLGLIRAMPRTDARHSGSQPLLPVPGAPPDLSALPVGCAFAPRCAFVIERCLQSKPPLTYVDLDRTSACFRSEEL